MYALRAFTEALGGPNKVITALKDCAIVCLMRERTLFGKDVIDALPNLTTNPAPRACAERGDRHGRRRSARHPGMPPRIARATEPRD